ncbi:hypothetical protein P692DRAFT_20103101 [Suillus brevipes Sb2]|nr:hypothetical protein P692DRAFT_20103101 [Suillus brevipes Sb2]
MTLPRVDLAIQPTLYHANDSQYLRKPVYSSSKLGRSMYSFVTLTFHLRSSAEDLFLAHSPDVIGNLIPSLSIVRCTTQIIPQDQRIISARSNVRQWRNRQKA